MKLVGYGFMFCGPSRRQRGPINKRYGIASWCALAELNRLYVISEVCYKKYFGHEKSARRRLSHSVC
jgi:hypothetical protein